jgi:hypothetical protein
VTPNKANLLQHESSVRAHTSSSMFDFSEKDLNTHY